MYKHGAEMTALVAHPDGPKVFKNLYLVSTALHLEDIKARSAFLSQELGITTPKKTQFCLICVDRSESVEDTNFIFSKGLGIYDKYVHSKLLLSTVVFE